MAVYDIHQRRISNQEFACDSKLQHRSFFILATSVSAAMSTVSRAVERLGQTFRNILRLQDNRAYLTERKEITIGHLDWLFTKVEELKTPYIEQADLNKFNIKVNIFDPSSEEENAATEWNLFYQPMSSTQLRQFAINTDRHPEDRERLEAYERNVDEPMKYVSRIFCTGDGLQNLFAEYFASRADYYFSGAPRGDIGSSLRSVSKWLPTYVSLPYHILHYT